MAPQARDMDAEMDSAGAHSSSPPPLPASHGPPDPDGFEARAQEALESVRRMKEPLLVNHFDCDGLSSGSVVVAYFESLGRKVRVKTVRKLDDATVECVRNEPEVIFTDLGGGHAGVNDLSGHVVIFDHHQTAGITQLQLNPHLFGFDGGTALSGSTTTYWALRTLPEVAIVGAVGDMQYPFSGLNRALAAEFASEGWLEMPIDLRFYGRMSRPLPQLLAYADDPFLPGLGGHEERCAQFLENMGIAKKADGSWPSYAQIGAERQKKLVGALAAHLAEAYGGSYSGEQLVGETYLFPRLAHIPELHDAGEFSTLLNACGRHERMQLGMDVCLGRPGALEEARGVLAEHKRALREGVEFAYRNMRDWGPFLFLDARGVIDDGIVGVVAGMVNSGARQKPILAVSIDAAGRIKASGRGTKKLVASGLNLGMALKEACAATGGQGGGHKIAAGATVLPERLDEFLKLFAEIVQRQLEAHAIPSK